MSDTTSASDLVQPSVLNQDNAAPLELGPASSEGHHEDAPPCLEQTLEDEKAVEETKPPSQGVSGHVTPVAGLTNSQSEGPTVDPDSNGDRDGRDEAETPAMECSAAASQTRMDPPQNVSVALGPCTSALTGGGENPQCNLEGDPETKRKGCGDVALADVAAVTEDEVALPPKKKQRMAAMEQNGTEVQPQPSSSPEDGRKEADSAVASDEAGVLCGPGCFKSSEDQECDPRGEPGAPPPAVCPEQQQTGNLAGAVDLEFQGCVSDSQLNTIALTEDLMMESDLGSSACPDATDLMCGLIRELSLLNQKVMAAHRQLENLHRSSKSSHSALR